MTDSDRTTQLLELLDHMDVDQIDAALADLDRKARRLRAMRAALGEEAPRQLEIAAPAVDNDKRVKPKPSDKRPLILALLEREPSRSWNARQVREELVARGQIDEATTMESIRVTLRRMVIAGQIRKQDTGQYRAATQGVP